MTIKRISKDSLRDKVYQSVRRAIVNGHFLPGTSITIHGISDMMGTSTMPVREALRQLASDGALEILPNRTIRLPHLTRSEFEDLTALRCHLECIVAVRGINHVTPSDLTRLEAINQKMLAAHKREDYEKHLSTNREFHSALYKLSHSKVYSFEIERIWLRIGPLMRFIVSQARFSNAAEYHRLIVQGLSQKDPHLVRASVEDDIMTAARAVIERYDFSN